MRLLLSASTVVMNCALNLFLDAILTHWCGSDVRLDARVRKFVCPWCCSLSNEMGSHDQHEIALGGNCQWCSAHSLSPTWRVCHSTLPDWSEAVLFMRSRRRFLFCYLLCGFSALLHTGRLCKFVLHSQLQSICKAIDGDSYVARNLWSQFRSLADVSSCIACSFHSPVIRLAARRCKLQLLRIITLHIMWAIFGRALSLGYRFSCWRTRCQCTHGGAGKNQSSCPESSILYRWLLPVPIPL